MLESGKSSQDRTEIVDKLSFLEAADRILRREGKPLSAEQITSIALAENLIYTSGKTPSSTMSARIYVDINRKGENSRFAKVERGVFYLKELWDMGKPKEPSKKPPRSLHDEIKQTLYEIGVLEGRVSEKEYPIDGERIDVVWKRVEGGYRYAAFEVQIGGNFYEALAKLKHAWDKWNSCPFLVTTDQYRGKALEWIRGSFHEIEAEIKIVDCEKVKELYEAIKKAKNIKEELGIK